jgi:hypothetical protein
VRGLTSVLRRRRVGHQGLIKCVNAMGHNGPWGVEVISEKLALLPLKELNTRAFNTTMAEFDKYY